MKYIIMALLTTVFLSCIGMANACTNTQCSQNSRLTCDVADTDCKKAAATCNASTRPDPSWSNPMACHKCSWKKNSLGGTCS